MTPEEIQAKVAGVFDSIEVDGGKVIFCQDFTVVDDEDEPNDWAAWTLSCLREFVDDLGLELVDCDSDNDSVWGTIQERKPE